MMMSMSWFKRFCAVNIPLVATALLTLSLLSILLLVISKGMTHFSVKPIYQVSHSSFASPVLGMVQNYGAKETDIFWFDPIAKELQSSRMALSEQQITLHQQTFVIKTRTGKLLFAQGLMLDDAPFSKEAWQRLLDENNAFTKQIEQLNSKIYPLELRFAQYSERNIPLSAPVFARLQAELETLHEQKRHLQKKQQQNRTVIQFSDGATADFPVSEIALIWQPNAMSFGEKMWFSMGEFWRFITSDHQAVSGSAGIFPALFGTVLMVFLMTVFVMPIGVLTAIYLHEYAPDNHFVSGIRVIIINLAGIPSIVYGVFGLGLFIMGLGTQIDQIFYAQNLPSPTFGTPGILWASITMALLTLPTVIVATEEGLQQVPQTLRNGALALGATKYEAIRFNVLPMASPNILTGAILSIARAASEVAPLLLVGAVIYAPTLPVDDIFPYLHLERQFMHLGVLIFDSVFHSANTFDSQSMMFAICLLLIIVVLSLNVLAAILRAKLRRRYERYS